MFPILSSARMAARGPRPRWAAWTVRGCVAGLLVLPVAVPLLLALTPALAAGPQRRLAFSLGLAAWLGLFAAAQALVAHPPAGGRR